MNMDYNADISVFLNDPAAAPQESQDQNVERQPELNTGNPNNVDFAFDAPEYDQDVLNDLQGFGLNAAGAHQLGFDVWDENLQEFGLKAVWTHQRGKLIEHLGARGFDPSTFVLAFEHFQPFFGRPWDEVLRFYLTMGFHILRIKKLMKEAIASGKWEITCKWAPCVVVSGLPSAIPSPIAPVPPPAAAPTIRDDIVTLIRWLQSNSPLTEGVERSLERVFLLLQE